MIDRSPGTHISLPRVGVPGRRRLVDLGVFTAKSAITVCCFWYLARNVDVGALLRAPLTLDLQWTFLAIVILMAQIPLIGLRWRSIVDALDGGRDHLGITPAVACTAIAGFFAQVVPNIAADSLRAWMLTRLGRGWRLAVASVMIDRAMGVAALFALGFAVLQSPSPLAALNGHRATVSEIFGGVLIFGGAGLVLAPRLAAVLELWRFTAWIGRLAKAAHAVLLARSAGIGIAAIAILVHALTIIAVWLLAHAAGLQLSIADAAVLFVVVVAVALIPVSIGGWGVRELTVTSLLAGHGVPAEKALFFSVSFGLALLIAALPGALVWALYSPGGERLSPAAARK